MDPSLFHIDYERLMEVLITIVVLSFFIERALSIFFESRRFIELTEGGGTKPARNGLRELIALIVSVGFCFAWDFDAITIVLQSDDHMTFAGTIITGAVIAGGSKASIGLFKDLMKFMSNAEKQRREKLGIK